MDWGAYNRQLRTRRGAFALSWAAGSEGTWTVDVSLFTRASEPNGPTGHVQNEKFSALLAEARQVSDQAKRRRCIREGSAHPVEDAPWVFVDHEIQIAATRSACKGFNSNPSSISAWRRSASGSGELLAPWAPSSRAGSCIWTLLLGVS